MGQAVGEGDRVRIVVGIVLEVEIIEAGRVFEEVDDPHGIGCLPGIAEGQAGRAGSHRIVEVQATLLLELEDRQGDEGLRGRADAEEGVGRGVAVRGEMGFADAGDPDVLRAGDEGDAAAGDAVFGEEVSEGLFELGGVLGWRVGRGGGGGQDRQEAGQQKSHGVSP
ncbi:MAG: hypothetical protein M5U12_02095 [Verrucomicrobia bacterium]|nr:hypothetical protein [Verrucomicrobiota bacterium]